MLNPATYKKCMLLVPWSKKDPDFQTTHLPLGKCIELLDRGPHWLGTAVSMAGGLEVFQKGGSLGPLTHGGQPLGAARGFGVGKI